MLELHLRLPGFTYSAFEPFTKRRERIQKFTETSYLKHIYKNELDKACFAHDAAYSDSKYLAKRLISDMVLEDKFYKIAVNLKYDGSNRGLSSLVYKFFDEKAESGVIATSKVGDSANEELAQELHKLVVKNFKRKKVYARFKDKIWAADLADIG